jgi:hypothetical protein
MAVSLLTRGIASSLSPAFAAALALITIQVGIGLLYKASQTGGQYVWIGLDLVFAHGLTRT